MKKLNLLTLLVIWCMAFAPAGVNAQFLYSQTELPSLTEMFTQKSSDDFDKLILLAQKENRVTVIVGLNLDTLPLASLSEEGRVAQYNAIKNMQDDLLSRISGFEVKVAGKFDYIPFISLSVDEAALRFMRTLPIVKSMAENRKNKPMLAESRAIVGAVDAETMGYTGEGQVIAIIDSGVDKDHTFLANKVVSEACYSQESVFDEQSQSGSDNLCPGGVDTTDEDSGLPCYSGWQTGPCSHGTFVAGIAAGKGTNSGIAEDAKLVAIMAMTEDYFIFNKERHTSGFWIKDNEILKGLERVLYLKLNTQLNIAAVNISVGNTVYETTEDCEGYGNYEAYEDIINDLKAFGVATVISSGNNNIADAIAAPSCVEPAISVGATGDGSSYNSTSAPLDYMWDHGTGLGSNSADILDLLAPGAWITSSRSVNTFDTRRGTSFAAPHVAGAWAVLKERFPGATVDQVLDALVETGTMVEDTRTNAGNREKPRINIDTALTYLEANLKRPPFDFNGDGKTDVAIYRASDTNWYVRRADGSSIVYDYGTSGDKLVPADFNGDGVTEIAVWRDSNGKWYIHDPVNYGYSETFYGTSGDIPAPGDFDGDGKDDLAVFRPSNGTWYVQKSGGGSMTQAFGTSGDKPVVGDYDGDGLDDIAIFRPSNSNWWILRSSDSGSTNFALGSSGDKTVQGDFTGDGTMDAAVFRPSTSYWYIRKSDDGSAVTPFAYGSSGDVVVPGDYDGDGDVEPAVFRPSENNWYLKTASGYTLVGYGSSGDVPLPNVYSVP